MDAERKPPTALVLDADRPAAVAVIRSIGRAGFPCVAAAPCADAIGFASRYARDRVVYPDPTRSRARFQDWLREAPVRLGARVVVPVTDLTLAPLAGLRQELEPRVLVAAARNDALDLAWSKSATTELAVAAGVPCPRTAVAGTGAEALRAAAGFDYPVVVKPDRSVNWRDDDRAAHSAVSICRTPAELELALARAAYPVLLQEYVAGDGIGFGVLCERGRILETFQWKRLHEVPLDGGGSSYRISEPADPVLLGHARALAERLQWDGVAMFEFKRDRVTRRYALMEINGRFWGSLPLAVAAGADFPANFVRLLLQGGDAVRAPGFRPGVRCRNLTQDLEWLRGALARLRLDRPVPPGRILADSLRLLLPGERFDLQSLDDWRPGLGELRRIGARARGMVRYRGRAAAWRRRALALRADPRELVVALRDADEIVTVCSANRVRSVYAERRLREWLPATEGPTVRSAGTEARAGTAPDERARAVALARGVDFGTHRAAPSAALAPSPRRVFLAMEARHAMVLEQQFPGAAARVFLLGSCLDDGAVEIPDPIDRPEAEYDARFADIDRAIRKCAGWLAARPVQERVP